MGCLYELEKLYVHREEEDDNAEACLLSRGAKVR